MKRKGEHNTTCNKCGCNTIILFWTIIENGKERTIESGINEKDKQTKIRAECKQCGAYMGYWTKVDPFLLLAYRHGEYTNPESKPVKSKKSIYED